MLRPVIFLSALLLPSVTFAQCPGQADLYQGISLTFDTHDTEVYYTGLANMIVNEGSDNLPDSAANWTIQLAFGVFETYVFERAQGYWTPTSAFHLSYDFDYTAVLPLVAGDIGGGVQTLVEEDGTTEPATYSYSVHAVEDVVIGDCSYAAFDFYQTYLLEGGGFGITRSVYLKDIGIAYIVESFWDNLGPSLRVATGISADG
ncbi:MAG: hypothetical protein L3J33_10740 [Rhodobacteraceae bacterium]|nr:hypothetical protein [Paracoccaceae bacterium]